MLEPGTRVGPLRLPISYSLDQLREYGWNKEKGIFEKTKKGPWGSRLNNNRWSDQGPRSIARPTHYKTKGKTQ